MKNKLTKRMVKLVSLIISAMLVLSACGNNGEAGETLKLNGENGSFITKEPTELTIFYVRSDNNLTEELDVWKEVAKKTNVTLKTTNSTNVSDAKLLLNTMLASGELPDMIIYSNIKNYAEQYGKEGAFVPIDELISDDTPNIKEQFERPEVKNFITATDGHVYYVPKILPGNIPANGWFIRQDWLDKLGLKAPTTIDEYYEVLKAFRDKDPNGNGKADEIPFFCRFKNADGLLEMQNVPAGWGIKDGKVCYYPATQEYKDAISLVAKWYAEDLIDKEIFTRGTKSREKLFGENLGGSTHDYFGTTAQFNDLLAESVPGFKLVAIKPLGGKEYTTRAITHTGGAVISASSTKKEVAIRFLDYLYSEEGSRLMNFGIEGHQYDMKDGKPYFNDSILHGNDTAINELASVGACSDFPFIQDFWYEEQWLTEEALKGFKLYEDSNCCVEPFPTLSYTDEELERFTILETNINTYVQEYKQKWIMGSENVETTFDTYIKGLEKMGIKEFEEIQQKAYDRYMKANK